ncbi:extracellular signal-regulated kinase [Acrasis kona]|uniref:Extracellular signal-regulated kinase n=1 Tax=Acrasis kona TaxID=1008807 RepID=A0AAW2Z759_9EUKA
MSSKSTSTSVARSIHPFSEDQSLESTGVPSNYSEDSQVYRPKTFMNDTLNGTQAQGTPQSKHLSQMNELHTIEFNDETFTIPRKYKLERIMGQGSYGLVCSAVNTLTNEKVAIKKNKSIFPSNTFEQNVRKNTSN